MIIFFDKRNGRIFSTIDGRVHNQITMNNVIFDDNVPKEFVGKFIIGWEETNEQENYEVEVEKMTEIFKGLFRKIKVKETRQRNKRIEHNLDKFEMLQRFEDNTPENPMDYKIINNNLIKK